MDRNIDLSTVHAAGTFEGGLGNLQADVLHNLEGRRDTQYDVALQSGLAIGANGVEMGARDLEQSAIVVAVNGDARDTIFSVLVNNVPRGQVRIGRHLLLFVAPYRTYDVRLLPVAAVPVDYDTASRQVTLYPGNVQSSRGGHKPISPSLGKPYHARAPPFRMRSSNPPKASPGDRLERLFPLDVRRDDPITIAEADGQLCQMKLATWP